MYEVKYNSRADADLIEIADYIAEESMSLDIALDVVSKMRKRIGNRLGIFPLSGKVEDIIAGVEYRKIIIGKYSIIYKMVDINDDEVVMVTNVIHGAREDSKDIIKFARH